MPRYGRGRIGSALLFPAAVALSLALEMLVPLVAVAAGQAAATPAAAPDPVRTDVRLFVPAGPGGLNVGLAVTAREEGSCFAGSSAAATRGDAWRCGVGNGIVDPCFADPFMAPGDGGVLYCAESPFAGDVIELTLTEPLSAEGGNEPVPLQGGDQAGILPWALELANGEQCTLLTGATAPIAGLRLNYGCESGASVLGDIDHSQPLWVVNYLADEGYATNLVGVAAAWT